VQNQELEPSVEVAHLRRLLDTQPSCLMRLGADGTVLAANDAALMLLGVQSGAQALGRDFSAWVPMDQRERWKAFATGVVFGHAASIECDIAAPTGDRQPTLFHGVPLTEHPDGVSSMAVAARAVSGQRQIEAAVVELEEQLRERDADRLKARARLAEAEASRRELSDKLAQLEARLRQREAAPADDGQLRQLRADLEARDVALATADAARRAAEAKAAAALADVRQLELALDGFAARQKQMAAERAAERQQFQEMSDALAARHEQELAAARDLPERERLAAKLQEREATVRALEAAWTEQQAALEAAQQAREHLEAELQRTREASDERGALAARLDEVTEACREREATLRQKEAAQVRLAAAHAALTADHERLVRGLREQAGRLEALANGDAGQGDGAGAPQAPVARSAGSEEGAA
jgi:hypothetical protein